MKSYVAIRGINGEEITVKQCDDGYAIRIDAGSSFATASLRPREVATLIRQLMEMLEPNAPADRLRARIASAEVLIECTENPFSLSSLKSHLAEMRRELEELESE